MGDGNSVTSDDTMVVLPFSGDSGDDCFPVLRFEEPETESLQNIGDPLSSEYPEKDPGMPELSDAAMADFVAELEATDPEMVDTSPLPGAASKQRQPGFEEQLVRSGLASLEHDLIAFVRKYLNFPFRVNTAFRVHGYSAVEELMERIGLLEDCLAHGIQPSRAGLVAAAKIRIAFGKADAAAGLLGQVVDPGPEIVYFLVLALHRTGDLKAALAACSGMLPGYQPRSAALYLEAVLLVGNGRADEGLERLRSAHSYFKNNIFFLEYYLDLADLLKSDDDAADALRALLELEPDRSDRLERLAALLYAGENFEEAAELYLRISDDGRGGEETATFRYAICLAYTGGEERAAELLAGFAGRPEGGRLRDILFELMEQGMDDPVLRPLIARTWLVEGDAESCLNFVDSLAPGKEERRLLLMRAEARILLADFKGALETLETIRFDDPFRAAEQAFFKGLSLYSLERYRDALSCFHTAAENGFRKEACGFYLGEMALREGRFREAVGHLQRSRKGGFKKRQSTIALAYAALKGGMHLVAVEAFEDVLRIDPDYADAYNSLGILYAKQDRSDDATAVLKKGLERFPDDRELHHNLSLVYEGVLKKRSRDHFRRYRELEALADGNNGEA